MRKGFLLKSFSMLMALVMLVVCIPAAGAQAIADEITERKALAEAEEVSLEEAASYDDNETTEYEIIEEVVEKRTENQKEFLLSDGSFLVAVYGNAVHYEEDGEWVDIDNTLVFEAGEKQIEQAPLGEAEITEEIETLQPDSEMGTENDNPDFEPEAAAQEPEHSALPGEPQIAESEPARSAVASEKIEIDELVTRADEFSGYKNTANTFGVKFASDLSQGVLYNVTENKYSITMSLVEKPDSSNDAVLLGQSIQPLSAQASSEESVELEKTTAGVEYGEVYDDVDIQYSLGGSSIKEDIIIKSPDAPSSYTFRFVVEGLKVEQFEGTYISFIDENTGEELYFIPQPFAYDKYGQILFNSWQTLEDKGDGVYELTIAIGEEYMDEEVCAFPITVDPILVKAASVYYGTMSGYKVGWANEAYPTNVWNNPQTMVAGNLQIGGVNGDIRRLRTHFQWNLPTLEDGATIVNSQLRVCLAFSYNYLSSAYNLPVNAYTMDRSWNATGMTWNNHPLPHRTNNDFIEGILTPIDGKNFYCSGGAVESNHYAEASFDITQAVQGWYQGTEINNGIVFAGAEERNNTHASYAVFYSPYVISDYVSEFPYFTLNYRTAVGTESYWDTYAHTPGASMAGNVNLHNGSLSLTTSIFNDRTLRMPFSYSYTYNSIKTNSNYGAAPYAAKGWVTNISQKITKVTDTAYTSLGYKYIYMDADGTEHWFYTYQGKIVDEDGLNLTILESNSTYYILETKAKDRLYFRRSDGALSHYEGFNDENKTQLSYTSGPAVRITAPGNRVSEVYKSTTTNCISSFHDPMGYTSYFNVATNGQLTQISLGASKSSAVLNYEYHPSNGLLTRVSDSLGNKTEYSYNSRKQVVELKQFVMNTATSAYVLVNYVKFDYSVTNQTVVRGWGADEVMGNSDDILTTYIFDGFGSTINVHTTSADKGTMYSTSSYQYTDRKSDNPNANPEQSNRIEVAGYASGNAENLIANGNFEKMTGTALSTISGEMSGWSAAVWRSNGNTTDDFIVALDNSNSMFGAYSLKMQINEDVSNGNTLAAAYEINLEPGTYVIHGYVKTDLSDDFGGYVNLSANGSGVYNNQYHNQTLSYYGPKSGVNQVEHAEIMSHDENRILEGWIYQATRFHVSGTGLQSVSVGVVLANNNGPVVQGSVWLDGVKLERIGNAYSNNGGLERFSITTWSDFNLVSNGSFESNNASNIPNGWSVTGTGVQSVSGNYVGTTPVDALFGNYSIRMGMTNKYTTSTVYQMIPIDGNKGDVYVLGGWAKGMPIASGGDYGIKATVYYYNGTNTKTSTSIAHFNKYYIDWQHTSTPVVIEDMGAGYVARSIKVELLYKNMASYAVFDNIQIIKDAGYSYSYDSKGNLVSTTDYNDRKVGIIYDPVTNLPTTYVDAKGNEYTYEYDSDRNLVGTTTPLGIITSTDYNDFGQALSGTITPIGGDATGENSIYTYNEYSTDGNFLVGATNSRGYSSNTEYSTTTGLVESTTNAAGITTYYDYGANGLLYETSAEVNETTLSVEMDYNNRNQMIFYSNGNTDYNISYTPLGQYKSFTVGDPNNSGYMLIDFLYDAQGRIKTETFGDGGIRYYYYDSLGRLTSTYVKRPGSTALGLETSYSYDSNNRLIRSYSQSTRYGSSTVAAYYFTYAMDGKVTGVSNGMYSTNYGYDERSNLSFTTINYPMTVQGKTGYRDNMVIWYQYDEDSNITDANISSPLFGDTSSHNTYDDLGRLEDTKYVLTSGAELSVGYDYAQGSRLDTNGDAIVGGGQTTLVNGAEYYLDAAASPFDGFRYEYDILGNITQIERYNESLDDYELYASYVYDDLSQLIRENDVANDRTVIYNYDNFGNILSEKIYAYTTAATPSGTYTENTWEYDDPQWGDLLSEYNGEEIIYDGLGNPTEYLEGMVLGWESGQRKLNNVNTERHTVVNYYDASGLLNYKTVRNKLTNQQDKTVRYWFDGDKLVYEYRCLTPNNTTRHQYLIYYYDTGNQLYGFGMYDYPVPGVAKVENYYYLRSPNGDIVGILDADGELVVSYAYDAWGNILDISGSMASTIGEINPFRYKGYYYDRETGFYYLQSRYYDPVTHRFLNADSYASTGQGFTGNNMFAYCLNNPVNLSDPNGATPIRNIAKGLRKNLTGSYTGATKSGEKSYEEIEGYSYTLTGRRGDVDYTAYYFDPNKSNKGDFIRNDVNVMATLIYMFLRVLGPLSDPGNLIMDAFGATTGAELIREGAANGKAMSAFDYAQENGYSFVVLRATIPTGDYITPGYVYEYHYFAVRGTTFYDGDGVEIKWANYAFFNQ